MKYLIIAVALSITTVANAQLTAFDTHPDWVPPGWQLLATGPIKNVSPFSSYDNRNSFIVIPKNPTVCTSITFSTEAPLMSDILVERAFDMSLFLWGLDMNMRVFGSDCRNGSQIYGNYP